ncbi:GTP-binding protein gtr1 [Verticillium nonalfalfae]|uniref:GTP-binding protein n=2 Tax=Verticillium TaxID=1036719 RepID=C9SRS9_VERA1|nr:GTP-binding protein GTR1 [Verticillium alfalfae VaMs.102]XP_028498853.1 GTP-binding protein gtr1 [Verticillium nonalfalfae]EEY21494.1 GTP-binding protein GTR1 [Verticillium alfalfae VaMs.102]RNJ60695.1 GTP-binding protein gtr1 [Verticillium nonalfalfae]
MADHGANYGDSQSGLPVANATKNEVKKPKKKKVLLMGKSGSGKSSMRSIIFSNYIARDTRRLGATIDIDLSHVKFLGNLTLNLWDCGGQEAFMENYLSQQRVHVFSNVGVLIYVFDIESRDVDRDLATYVSILSALLQFSPQARIYVLIHKMDLVVPAHRESVYDERVRIVRQKTAEYAHSIGFSAAAADDASPTDTSPLASAAATPDITPFATSIWDQSLYKAWASIIHDLVPNLATIERNLANLGTAIEAEELLLFERTSFLAVSSWTSPEGLRNPTEDRLERMSNIMKHFKQSISRFTGTPRNAEQFVRMEHKAGLRFNLFILKFTTNTYLMVVLPPGEARFNAAMLNCQIAIEHFKFLDGPATLAAQGVAS